MSIGPVGQRLVVTEYGETPLDALDNFIRLEQQAPPDPAVLEPDDVVLRVRSCAVGWVDLIMSSGQYQHMAPPPYTPGLEFAGEVAWVGSGVASLKIGDRVLADGFSTGPRSHGRHQRWGGCATWAVIPEHAALSLSPRLSYDQAVNLLGNFETAMHVLDVRAQVQAGEWVLVLGATGSTGLAAVQLAKMRGALVIAAGRSPEKLAEVKAHGADHVLQTDAASGGLAGMRGAVKALTGGKGVHVVWDGVGGDISVQALRCMRFGGRFCIVGWAATPFVARGKGKRGAPRANLLPTNLIQMKGLDVLGCPAVISTRFDPTLRPIRLKRILAGVEDGSIVPHVGPGFGMADYAAAFRAKWESRFVGGCVLHP